mgnify:CR=1 FL=1
MIRAGIVGASGYSGAELMRILASRRDVKLEWVTANTSAGQRVDELYPALAGRVDLAFREFVHAEMAKVDVAFVALPSGQGMQAVPKLKGIAARVIDLGGDYRLKNIAEYKEYYGHDHVSQDLLAGAVYGLSEVNREAIGAAKLVANPGCYATSVILGLLPALAKGLVEPDAIAVSAVSGISGAGRTSKAEMNYTELNENVRAYKPGTHQHVPEIEGALKAFAGVRPTVSFIPHLVPLTRGIYATMHARLKPGVTAEAAQAAYEQFYAGKPFVRVKRGMPQISAVTRSNFCDIGLVVNKHTGQLVVMSTIDNLVKGAAGQAVQNMNIMFGLPEDSGLN